MLKENIVENLRILLLVSIDKKTVCIDAPIVNKKNQN